MAVVNHESDYFCTLDVVKERCLLLYIQRINTKHLQLDLKLIINSSQCLEITSNIYIPLFLKAKFCLRSNFWKAVLCCHEGYTFSGIYHGLRIMLLILRTTNFVRI